MNFSPGILKDKELFDEDAFDSALEEHTSPISVFKKALSQSTDVLIERFKAGRAATELVHARAKVVDEVLKKAWLLYFPKDAEDIALIAVGGYGRGELHPASDVDVQILLKKDAPHYD